MPLLFDDEDHRALERCLGPEGPLRGLISECLNLAEDPFGLDIQPDESGVLHYVHGTVELLAAGVDLCDHFVLIHAGTAYHNRRRGEYGKFSLGDSRIIDVFHLEEADQGVRFVIHYLKAAIAACQDDCYRDGRRGYWLNRLSLSLCRDWHPGCEWIVLDRDRTIFPPRTGDGWPLEVYRTFRRFEILKHERQQADPERWGLPSTDGLERECDLIAIGPAGELLLIDLRHGSEGIDLSWSALKLAAYAETVRAVNQADRYFAYLRNLLRRRAALGLCPQEAWGRWPSSGFSRVVPLLVVAQPDDQSACWDRLEELANREPAARIQVVRLHRGQSAEQITLSPS